MLIYISFEILILIYTPKVYFNFWIRFCYNDCREISLEASLQKHIFKGKFDQSIYSQRKIKLQSSYFGFQ